MTADSILVSREDLRLVLDGSHTTFSTRLDDGPDCCPACDAVARLRSALEAQSVT